MSATIQAVHGAWRDFGLPKLQEELDATANELANRQDESETSRKSLVELSRDFKKNTPEDVRRSVAPLLKSFQSEVDSLSKRSKAAEAAFLNVYKRVIDVPDPVPALETAQNVQKRAEKAHDLEVENEQLRVTLHQYNSEFADCKNQEVTIKQLRERIRALEDSVDAESTKRSAEREKDLQRQAADRERQLQEAQLDLVRRLGEAELRCASLQRALSAAGGELNEARAKHDEALQAKQQEMEMLMQDAENANERALNAERLVERLRSQLEEAARNLERQGGPLATEQAMEALSRSALQLELNAKEKEVAHLVADVKRLHATLAKLKETSGSHMTQMEDELRRKDDALAKLDDRLSSQADYDELKHELSIMKAMEFAGQESPASQRLEGLLLTKNRALQSENTQLRLSTTSLQECSQTDAFAQLIGQELVCSRLLRDCEATSEGGVQPDDAQGSDDSDAGSCATPEAPTDREGSPLPPALRELLDPERLLSDPCQPHEMDTAVVACRVRELLSRHNIGQRLFAKHVLGLSQGTVSELLSKPKAWPKLTEKGKESYRKMYAWLHSAERVDALRALCPRKYAKEGVIPDADAHEDGHCEERVAAILVEAKKAMQANTPASPDEERAPASPALSYKRTRLLTPPSEDALRLSKEFVSRIYQRELAGLLAQQGGPGALSQDRLDQPLDLSHSAFSPVPRRDDDDKSLPSWLPMLAWPAHADSCPSSPRPLKPVLPPVTQEHFDRFSELDTDALVHSVRDLLSRHSISQRLFGERVLGLSQGSVSDLLARPKPWRMLTQKGREPFIRMRLFLESGDRAVQRLLVSQTDSEDEVKSKCPAPSPREALSAALHYDPSAFAGELDTVLVTARVREVLQAHNIGQKVFGEAVLHLSQGSVSELLSRPKPWRLLSVKGREPFIRMWLWLHDYPASVDALRHLKHGGHHKRRLSAEPADSRSSDDSPPMSSSKRFKTRAFFTEEQKEALVAAYERDPYPSTTALEQLAADLQLELRTVINWFHNHRMRLKWRHSGLSGSASCNEDGTTRASEDANNSSSEDEAAQVAPRHSPTRDAPSAPKSKRKSERPQRCPPLHAITRKHVLKRMEDALRTQERPWEDGAERRKQWIDKLHNAVKQETHNEQPWEF